MRGFILDTNEEEDGCDLEGCRGHAVLIRWDDGTEAWECSRAIDWDGGEWAYTWTEES